MDIKQSEKSSITILTKKAFLELNHYLIFTLKCDFLSFHFNTIFFCLVRCYLEVINKNSGVETEHIQLKFHSTLIYTDIKCVHLTDLNYNLIHLNRYTVST